MTSAPTNKPPASTSGGVAPARSRQAARAPTLRPVCQPVACTHCGLRVPVGLVQPGTGPQFCCAGCQTAHEVITSGGLDRYYALRRASPVPRKRIDTAGTRPSGRDFAEFDDPTMLARISRPGCVGAELRCVEFVLEGVHCAACVWLLERLPRLAEGVEQARLNLGSSVLRVVYDPSRTSAGAAARAIDRLGYVPHPPRTARAERARTSADRRALVRLGVAGACASNVMLLALALYAGAFADMANNHKHLFRWFSMIISVVSVAWPGSVFFRGAITGLRARTVGLDLPIALALLVGTAHGIIATVLGTGEIYFDSISVLVFALLLARFINQRQQRWAVSAVEHLFALIPSSAERVDPDGSARRVPIDALAPGDVLRVGPGVSIAADGVVVQGTSHCDESLLTGESRPVAIDVGRAVHAGSVNLSQPVLVRVTAVGPATRVGRILELMEQSSARRAPIVRFTDRIAGAFTAVVIALAFVTAALRWQGGAEHAIEAAVALLVVTCPCALGLATPLAMTVAIGRAAKGRMLVKGGDTLQTLASRGTIYLDKTGTITEGSMRVVEIAGDLSAVELAAALEAHSNHPIARSMVDWHAQRRSEEPDGAGHSAAEPRARDVHVTIGGGIQGVVDGWRTAVGSVAFAREHAGPLGASLASAADRMAGAGLTPVVVCVDSVHTAVVGVGDAIRPDAAHAVASLERLGWRVGVLSGDDARVVHAVASAIGIDPQRVHAQMSPEGKLREIEAALAAGDGLPVVMVGDGVNDAAALARANAGIAVHGGAEASMDAADVALRAQGLTSIVDLVMLARSTMATVKLNLVISLSYNALAASLAVTGLIGPLIAAVLMPVSSLTVVLVSLRAGMTRRTWGPSTLRGGRAWKS